MNVYVVTWRFSSESGSGVLSVCADRESADAVVQLANNDPCTYRTYEVVEMPLIRIVEVTQ